LQETDLSGWRNGGKHDADNTAPIGERSLLELVEGTGFEPVTFRL
jgi:hypothetical protein